LTGRIGLFGGTFDPPHNAHIAVAEAALGQCGLARVVFVPNGIPPQKVNPDGASKEDRLRMVEAAIEGHPGLEVSRIEIDREGPSYTIDTIRAMKEDSPQGLCFILGADRLLEIETWRESGALLRSVPFIVAPRAGVSVSVFGRPPFDVASIHVLEMDEVDLASTFVRDRTMRGESIEEWVPRGVARTIDERRLYRVGRGSRAKGTGG
jgi:nicotinate-nucleotide adenylyltransferase